MDELEGRLKEMEDFAETQPARSASPQLDRGSFFKQRSMMTGIQKCPHSSVPADLKFKLQMKMGGIE